MIYIAQNLHLKQCCQTHSVAHMTARAPNEPKMYTPPFGGHLYKLENWANKHLEVVDFIGVGILTPELTEMP